MKRNAMNITRSRTWYAAFAAVVALGATLSACPDGNQESPFANMDSSIIVDEHNQTTALVCPGAKGCENASGALRVGVAAKSITPVIETWEDTNGNGRQNGDEPFDDVNGNGVWDPVWIAGFSAGRAANGVHDDNWSRVVTLEQGDISMAIVSLDLVGYFHPDVIAIRLAAKDAGLDFDHIMVTSTHQHEGPDSMGLWGENNSVTGYDPAYIALVVEKTVEALAEAKENMQEATLRVATTEAPEYVNDTRLPIVIDQSIHAINFEATDGSVISTLLFWGNHPEALGSRNKLITSDFPHYIRESLEAHYPGSVAVYATGLLGGLMTTIGLNVCPDEEGEDTCEQGTFERAQVIGEGVAQKAIAALESADARTFSDDLQLGVRRWPYYVKTTNPKFSLALVLGLLTRRVYDDETLRMFQGEDLKNLSYDDILAGTVKLDTEVNHIRIGPLDLLTVPGELYPELWLSKEGGGDYIETPEGGDYPDAATETPLETFLRDDAYRIVVNQGNDSLGYIIPKTQFDVLRPRAYGEEGQYGEDNSLGEEAAPDLLENVIRLFELGQETP